ncbi:MAG TPA: DUF1353 domain-containing protein [Terriglobia bacterium]|nr:DUF1353 domain-containing protein [Terriglobia bacterium]
MRSSDGRNFSLVDPKEIATDAGDRYRMPTGACSDGASTPREIWGPPFNLPPFGVYWPAAFAHDCAYRNTLERWDGRAWVLANLTKDQSDELLDALMFALGTPAMQRSLIFKGVGLGGWAAFQGDRAAAK